MNGYISISNLIIYIFFYFNPKFLQCFLRKILPNIHPKAQFNHSATRQETGAIKRVSKYRAEMWMSGERENFMEKSDFLNSLQSLPAFSGMPESYRK